MLFHICYSMFCLPLSLFCMVKDQHIHNFTLQLSSGRELGLQCLHQWLSQLHWCFFFFLMVLLELSHVTLISKFSPFSLMSFLKIHLSAIDNRLKTPHVLSKVIIIIEQLKIQGFCCCFMNGTLRHF